MRGELSGEKSYHDFPSVLESAALLVFYSLSHSLFAATSISFAFERLVSFYLAEL
jgi:hypothetical protein